MSSTVKEKAVVGRRILFNHASRGPDQPAVITRLKVKEEGFGGGFYIRLDGQRSQTWVPDKFEWRVTYLDEVVPVPDLPMGRFQPTVKELDGEWEGVLVCTVSEDGDIILLTTDREAAVRAATAYFTEYGVDLNYVNFDSLVPRWAVFTWLPEDAETDWSVSWGARKKDDQAVHVYLLPA